MCRGGADIEVVLKMCRGRGADMQMCRGVVVQRGAVVQILLR